MTADYWYRLEGQVVLEKLQAGEKDLSEAEAAERLKQGRNEIIRHKAMSPGTDAIKAIYQ